MVIRACLYALKNLLYALKMISSNLKDDFFNACFENIYQLTKNTAIQSKVSWYFRIYARKSALWGVFQMFSVRRIAEKAFLRPFLTLFFNPHFLILRGG